ncbi:MAG: type II toxin-antitoxin system RelE/ParE family toxin [Defluviitaleaceae bacterium]|nr:type II toxin-antitoxin system RelE/ParE family toxin [Defluviitaleaceae bacterium]
MKRKFVEMTVFTKQWKALGLNDDDLFLLQNKLSKDPRMGNVISGTGGARKVRFAVPNKGKSGGARIIYVDIVCDEEIYLLLCYAKTKQDDLTREQLHILKDLIKLLKEAKHG